MKILHVVTLALCLTSVVQFLFLMKWHPRTSEKTEKMGEAPNIFTPNKISKEKYVAAWNKVNKQTLGCADFGKLYPLIASLYDSAKAPPLIDIGANLGAISSEWLNTLSVIDERLWQKKTPQFGRGCALAPKYPKILAIEGYPLTYKYLMQRATAGNWTKYGWEALHVVISDKAGDLVSLKGNDGLLGLSHLQKSKDGVPAVTVDEIVEKKLPGVKEIFILKIDIEGFDPAAIVGAHNTLEARLPRFIMFEYHKFWSKYDNGSWSLERMQKHLLKYGYKCYLISPDNLFPITGDMWDDAYEFKDWSNVIAVRLDEPAFDKILTFYNSIV